MMSASQGSSALKAAARPIVAVVSKRVPTAFSLFSVKASLTLMPSGGVKVYFYADLWFLDFGAKIQSFCCRRIALSLVKMNLPTVPNRFIFTSFSTNYFFFFVIFLVKLKLKLSTVKQHKNPLFREFLNQH